jgi:Type IV secretion system pilin
MKTSNLKKPLVHFSYLAFLFPSITFAFGVDLNGVVGQFFDLFRIALPLLNAIAFLLFFWGVAKFVLHSGDSKQLEEGKQFMIWGVVALFVLVSFWGILQFLSSQFGFGDTTGFQFLPQ